MNRWRKESYAFSSLEKENTRKNDDDDDDDKKNPVHTDCFKDSKMATRNYRRIYLGLQTSLNC
jgi:hypothetical protein